MATAEADDEYAPDRRSSPDQIEALHPVRRIVAAGSASSRDAPGRGAPRRSSASHTLTVIEQIRLHGPGARRPARVLNTPRWPGPRSTPSSRPRSPVPRYRAATRCSAPPSSPDRSGPQQSLDRVLQATGYQGTDPCAATDHRPLPLRPRRGRGRRVRWVCRSLARLRPRRGRRMDTLTAQLADLDRTAAQPWAAAAGSRRCARLRRRLGR